MVTMTTMLMMCVRDILIHPQKNEFDFETSCGIRHPEKTADFALYDIDIEQNEDSSSNSVYKILI